MAAPSPALSSNSSSLAATGVAGTSVAVSASFSISSARRMETPSGLKKPKCRVCGNVARSRCPYESCKNCCSKIQNPCHIHVLKADATFQDRTPTSNFPSFDQQVNRIFSFGSCFRSSLRMAYFRQLSNNFAQFNNVHISLRSRKPLSIKDAAAINGWRFLKLREYQERNIEAENEAFDRYMQNVSSLDEIFSMKSILVGSLEDRSSSLNRTSLPEDNSEVMVSGLKYMLQSNMIRSDNSRREYGNCGTGLIKLRKRESDGPDGINQLTDQNEPPEGLQRAKSERGSALSALLDKLNKSQNEDDLKSCLEMKSELLNQRRKSGPPDSKETDIAEVQDELELKKKSTFSMPKLLCTTEIDQDTLNRINVNFSSLEEINDL